MKNLLGKTNIIGAAAIGLGFLPCAAQAATIFTNGGFAGSGQTLPSNYGDRVTASSANFTVTSGGTPNVVVDYDVRQAYPNENPGTGSFLTNTNFPTGQGSAIQLSNGVNNRFFFIFTPDPGYAVQIDSWDVLEAPGGGSTTFGWVIHPLGDYIGTYASGDDETFTSSEDTDDLGGRANIAPGVLGAVGQTLVLSITPSGNNPASVAVDNITFSQVAVPEPGMVGFAVLGLGAMGMYRRQT